MLDMDELIQIIKPMSYKEWKQVKTVVGMFYEYEGFNLDEVELRNIAEIKKIVEGMSIHEWIKTKTTIDALFFAAIDKTSLTILEDDNIDKASAAGKQFFG